MAALLSSTSFPFFIMKNTTTSPAMKSRREHERDREKHDAICDCGEFPHCGVEPAAYTLVPWRMDFYDDYIVIYGSDNTRILDIYAAPSVDEDAEARANAHLIIAAPELLERCRMSLQDARDALSGDWEPTAEGWQATIENLEAVIAKAEGKTP